MTTVHSREYSPSPALISFSPLPKEQRIGMPFTIDDAVRFGSLRLEHAYRKDILGANTQSLIEEVGRVKQQEEEKAREGRRDREPWYHLTGTGFFVKGQVDLFLLDIERELGRGKDFMGAIDFTSIKIEEDIKGFEYEYLKQLAGLTWNIGWKDVDGGKRIYCPDYNDELLENITEKQERDGVLYDTWFVGDPSKNRPGIEAWLQKAPPGSKVVIVSPKGWSGYEGFTYPQTQIYVIEVGQGDTLKSFTLRYDVSIEENEELQRRLGLNISAYTDGHQRIKNMLRNVAYISPEGIVEGSTGGEGTIHGCEDIINIMEDVKGSPIAFQDDSFGERSFADIRAFVAHPENFLTRHPEAQSLIETFREYVHWEFSQDHSQQETRQNLEIALALIIVHLKGLYLGTSKQIAEKAHTYERRVDTAIKLGIFQKNTINYQNELEDLQKLPGCGGTSKVRLNSMGSSREAEVSNSGSEDYDFDHEGTCVKCGVGPRDLGPCDICRSCDAELGGKAANTSD